MDPDSLMIKFILLFILFILSAFFSSSETALTSINKLKLRHLVMKKNKRALLVNKLIQEPDKLLTTILVGNNGVNVFTSSLATSIAIDLYGDYGVFISSIVVTIVLLIFSEITPKTIAVIKAEKLSFAYAYPIKIIMLVFYPIVFLLTKVTRLIMKLLKAENKPSLFTFEEFKTLIDVGEEEGLFEPKEREMLYGVVRFKHKQVKDVLKTPRVDIIGISLNSTYKEVKAIIVEHQFSRYPVYDGSVDNIVGILYAKDLFKLNRQQKDHDFQVESMMKQKEEIIFVPETKKINELFTEMKNKKNHLAIVMDEYGGTEGLITLEEILETIVGEIEDETDKETERLVFEMKTDYAVVSPNISIISFNEKFKTQLPNGDIETIGGFIMRQLGRMPKKEEEIRWDDLVIKIAAMENNRMTIIKITRESS